VPRRGRRTGGAAFDGGRHVSFFDKAKAVDVRRFGTDPFLHHGADVYKRQGIGRSSGDDQFWPVPESQIANVVEIDAFGLLVNAVGLSLIHI